MTKRFLYVVAFAVCSVLLQNCTAIHTGVMQGSASLSAPNYRYAGKAFGMARCTYILGIGGNSVQGIAYQAQQDMYSRLPLRNGIALANVTTNKYVNYIAPCFVQVTMLVSADVIDFWPDTIKNQTQYGYYLNDSVFYQIPNFEDNPIRGIKTYERYRWRNALNQSMRRNDSIIVLTADQAEQSFTIGKKVLFLANGIERQGEIISINNWGFLCSYTDKGKTKYIYKQKNQLFLYTEKK